MIVSSASKPQVAASAAQLGRQRENTMLYAMPPTPIPVSATHKISPNVNAVPPRIGPNMRYHTSSSAKNVKPSTAAVR